YESYITIYYTCLSFISLNNLYDVNLYIKSSQLLSDAYHKLLYVRDIIKITKKDKVNFTN
ncbi:MAG: hypothetical protein PHY38_01255, partial [Bacilli bacterium]|nr:hypothetical protein [Bacilli bacterium]